MSLGDWFRRVFSPGASSGSPEDEAAEREEYGDAYPDTGPEDAPAAPGSVVAGGVGGFAGLEETEAAEAVQEEFEAPPDPAP